MEQGLSDHVLEWTEDQHTPGAQTPGGVPQHACRLTSGVGVIRDWHGLQVHRSVALMHGTLLFLNQMFLRLSLEPCLIWNLIVGNLGIFLGAAS